MSIWSRLGFGKQEVLHQEYRPIYVAQAVPPGGEIRDIPIVDQLVWDVKSIRAALVGHAGGTFGSAAALTDAMLSDDRVQSATNGRTKGVTKRTVMLEPSPKASNQRLAKKIVADIESKWSEIFPESILEEILKWQIYSGFCLLEIIWDVRDDMYVPRLKPWHPMFIYYRMDTRNYVVFTQNGAIDIRPNDPKWALYTPYGSYRGWMRGAVRSVAIPWLVRQFALRDWARYSEVHGLPQKKAKVPAQAPAEDKRRFMSSIKRLGAESAFLLPVPMGGGEWDVELLEAKADTWEAFQGLIEQCDKSITLTVRGTNLTTEVQTGTGAATQAHRDEDSDYAEADCRKLSEFIYKQILMAYALYNYGDANLAPIPHFELDVEDRGEDAKVLSTLATAAKAFKDAGLPLDRNLLLEKFDLPLAEEVEEEPDPTPQTTETDLPQE